MSNSKKYGSTKEEKWASEMLSSRQITQEVLNFGISQRQILQISYLLSLELENRSALLEITGIIKEHLEGDTTATESSKLIT